VSLSSGLRRYPFAAGALGLALVVVLYVVSRVVLPGKKINLSASDIYLYYYPVYQILYGFVQEGALPTWNPYQLTGIPGLASLQAGFFYPPHLLYFVLPGNVALAVLGVSHLVLVALSTAALVRRLGLLWPAAAIAAVAVAMRGKYPLMLFFPNMLEAAAWLPLGALAVLSIARGGGGRPMGMLALCAVLSLLAGYPQVTVYLFYAWGALLLVFLLSERRSASECVRAGGWTALALALGALMASVQLLPGIELAREGTRSPGGLERAAMLPWAWPGRSFLRAARAALEVPFPVMPLSLGGVVAVLLPTCLLTRRHRVLAFGSLALALTIVLFAMGPVTGLFDWFLALPTLSWFRFPKRAVFVADFCLSLGLAVAVQSLLDWCRSSVDGAAKAVAVSSGRSDRLWQAGVAGLGIVGFALLAVFEMSGRREDEQGLILHSAFFAAACMVVILLALAIGRDPARARFVPLFGPVFAGLLVLEIFVARPNLNMLWYTGSGLSDAYSKHRQVYDELAASSDRVWIQAVSIYPRIPPKVASLQRFRSVTDYEPLNLRRQAEYFTYLAEGRLLPKKKSRPFSGRLDRLTAPKSPGALAKRGRLLDVAAVRYFLIPGGVGHKPELAEYIQSRGFERRAIRDPNVALFENPHAVPRAFVVYDLRAAPPAEELLATMSEPCFDPLVWSYVDTDTELEPSSDAPSRGRPARIVVDEETVVEVEASLDAPGALVLADAYYPGWVATVDGKPAEILPANHLFRAVVLPKGSHRVRFEYDPWTVKAGIAVSLASSIALIVLVLRRRGGDLA
jgi:hypothetical protein